MEVEWINGGNSIILLGWYIHFDNMRAFGPRNEGEWQLNVVDLVEKQLYPPLIASYSRDFGTGFSDESKRRLSRPLFPHDEEAEALLQDAYHTYLLEKALKDDKR